MIEKVVKGVRFPLKGRIIAKNLIRVGERREVLSQHEREAELFSDATRPMANKAGPARTVVYISKGDTVTQLVRKTDNR